MPQLPVFTSSAPYQDAPPDARLNPAQLAAGDNAVADAMERVSSHFAEALAFNQQNQAAATAIGKTADLSMALTDKKNAYLKDPDPATAPGRFKDDVLAWQQQQLSAIDDPLVRAHVASHLAREVGSAYGQVAATSLGAAQRNQQSGVSQAMGAQAQLLAAASDPLAEANAASAVRQAAAGALAGGVFDPAMAATQVSRSFRDAIVIRAATDPTAAKSMLERYSPEMTADDVASMTEHLRNPLIRQWGNAIAGQTNDAAAATITPQIARNAQLWHDGLVARGFDDATSWAIAARGVLESGGNPNGPAGDGGISHGGLQWNKERLANYIRLNGHPPEQGTLDEQLDFIKTELNSTEAPAKAAIDAAPTLADKARAVSLSYVRPGLTDQAKQMEAARTAATAEKLAGGPDGMPLDARLADVRQRVSSTVPAWAVPEVMQHAETQVTHQYSLDQHAMADQRADLKRDVDNLRTGYEQGLTEPDVPEARIRSLLKPGDAQAVIETLRDTRVAGDLFKAVQFASPAEETQARQQLAVPGTVRAGQPLRQGKAVGEAADTGDAATETPEGLKARLHQLAVYDQLLQRKHTALTADPVAYTMTSPDVAAKFKAIDPTDPTTSAAAIQASLDLQAHLGLPESQQRVLTGTQVSAMVDQLHRLDPAKGDARGVLNQLAQQTGEHWPDAMGEMVKHGKLNPDYMVLAAMDHPAQAGAAQDFQRALMARAAQGPEKFTESAPAAETKAITQGLDGALEQFRQTTAPNGVGGLQLFSTMRDSVKTLATYYAAQGVPGSTALDRAVTGLLTSKYDMDGALRVPTGQLSAVRQAGRTVQQGLTAADIIARPELNEKTPAERADIMLSAAKRGTWATNAKDDGAVLMGAFRDGPMVMRRPDGSPIEIKWKNLPAVPAAAPLPDPNAMVP